MPDSNRIIFIHGLESSSQSTKAIFLRTLFPGMLTPDFSGSLSERMAQLQQLLADKEEWTIIGSSLGGLMGALFTTRNPNQVRKLILLAPALMLPEFSRHLPPPISTPTVVIHGKKDKIVPLERVRELAEKVFQELSYIIVNDDHRLRKTTQELDWHDLVNQA